MPNNPASTIPKDTEIASMSSVDLNCPLLERCDKEKCAWWDEDAQKCAVSVIAQEVKKIGSTGRRVSQAHTGNNAAIHRILNFMNHDLCIARMDYSERKKLLIATSEALEQCQSAPAPFSARPDQF